MKSRRLLVVLATACLAVAALMTVPTPGSATPAASNPLTKGAWPYYSGAYDGAYSAWSSATGDTRTQLAKIALKPRVFWFANRGTASGADVAVAKRIQEFQQGNRNAFAQLAIFGLYPNGEDHRKDPVTPAMQATYKAWINNVAKGIGSSKVIIVLEPDLGVAYSGWEPSVRFSLAAYASRVLSKLANVVVYLDASDADWLPVSKAIPMLIHSGIRNVRGFALGATHYSAPASNIAYGATLVRSLAAHGYPGKHFVIDTADNGRPFTFKQFFAAHPHGDFDNANVCATKASVRCVTLGIPPTTNVASTRWGMSSTIRATAARLCDAFLWYGRPWLYRQASPFQMSRALGVARTTRWQ